MRPSAGASATAPPLPSKPACCWDCGRASGWTKTHRALALSVLGRQQYQDILGRALPTDAHGQPRYASHTKSGELVGVHHDVGLLLLPRALCAALLSEGGLDRRGQRENRDTIALSDTLSPLLAALGGHYSPQNGDI